MSAIFAIGCLVAMRLILFIGFVIPSCRRVSTLAGGSGEGLEKVRQNVVDFGMEELMRGINPFIYIFTKLIDRDDTFGMQDDVSEFLFTTASIKKPNGKNSDAKIKVQKTTVSKGPRDTKTPASTRGVASTRTAASTMGVAFTSTRLGDATPGSEKGSTLANEFSID
ncbi:hypothetical protein NE237_004474 [Protea cynaroides]|uniref:Uncharacterized protein n=1 Tax=Protea cynaroides TaxID=273540 RepID=A0A9Q0KJ12_9MAGN|nr:hypothetical protein NE237_004474 [Protea cynaroides]